MPNLLVRLVVALETLAQGTVQMSAALDRLTQEVAEQKEVTASAVALIAGLAQQIRDNVDDSDALNALADSLDASQHDLADAVTANTPADGAPVIPSTSPQPSEPPAGSDTGSDTQPTGDSSEPPTIVA